MIVEHISAPQNQHKKIHFFVSSGGNAGLAAVTAARSLDYPCTVVLPTSTKEFMKKKLWAAGASDVLSHGSTISEAGEYMREELMPEFVRGENLKRDGAKGDREMVGIELPPFDDPRIWTGVSSIMDELAYQLPPSENENETGLPLDAIICSVGGGGLMNGLVEGLERHHCSASAPTRRGASSHNTSPTKRDVHIVATETDGTGSLALALQHKSLMSLPAITSLATSLGCTRVAERTLKNVLSPPSGVDIHSTVLHDAEAAKGVLALADEERILVELACGVCVEAAVGSGMGYKPSSGEKLKGDDQQPLTYLKQLVPSIGPDSRVVIIVCGGSNVNVEMAAEWRQRVADGWGKVDAETEAEAEVNGEAVVEETFVKLMEKGWEKDKGRGIGIGMGAGKVNAGVPIMGSPASWISVL